ncbi:MAG: type II toxin-antitoxin system VapC family toxin [Phycisphaerae bacterium]|nr:type II toxin-antitoxin system VapC family toxin [Phycisphaerae bacterium]
MNVVDSSAWLEYFSGGPNANAFTPPIENVDELLVPSIVLLEVFKRVLQQRGEEAALQAAAHMQTGQLVPLDDELALSAAKLGMETKLPLADSVILATAKKYSATVWTMDSDFQGLPKVEYVPKNKK